jgi:hypothetical protein
MRLNVELLDEYGHPKRRNRRTRAMERVFREAVTHVAKEHGLSPEDVVARLDLDQFMDRLTTA